MKLILIRGLPGSGKSTLAKTYEAKHVEADMYFIDKEGTYCFDPTQLPDAHKWCLKQANTWLKQGCDVVVSNTFVKQWELDGYRKLAKSLKAELVIKVCREQYQNIHGVGQETLERMARDWQE